MTLLEFAEKTSPLPLMQWQRDFLPMVETAINENKILTYNFGRCNGRTMVKNIVNQFYGRKVI
jgi:hypothetical protein